MAKHKVTLRFYGSDKPWEGVTEVEAEMQEHPAQLALGDELTFKVTSITKTTTETLREGPEHSAGGGYWPRRRGGGWASGGPMSMRGTNS